MIAENSALVLPAWSDSCPMNNMLLIAEQPDRCNSMLALLAWGLIAELRVERAVDETCPIDRF
jgi:hypothetical protein